VPAPPAPSPEPGEPEWESEGGPVVTPGIALTLYGADGGDPSEVLADLRAALPEGYRLERD
jgi:hypothetical protein